MPRFRKLRLRSFVGAIIRASLASLSSGWEQQAGAVDASRISDLKAARKWCCQSWGDCLCGCVVLVCATDELDCGCPWSRTEETKEGTHKDISARSAGFRDRYRCFIRVNQMPYGASLSNWAKIS